MALIAIDTSVWIEYFRGGSPALDSDLKTLLDEDVVCIPVPVWIELLSGASRKEQAILRDVLSALPRLAPGKNTWKTIESWVSIATKKGKRFGVSDLLIAAITAESNAKLWSLDSDFQQMSNLKLVSLY